MWLQLQIFGFRALWSPYFLTFILVLALAYFLMTRVFAHKFLKEEKLTWKQEAFFYGSLALLYIVKGSPIDLLSHIMMSAHMIQTATLYFIVAIFFIRGIPGEWCEKLINLKGVRPFYKFFTFPLISLALFNSLFAIYHLPMIFDFTKANQVVHSSTTIVLFILAIIMWWPVVTPVKSEDKLNPLIKMGYLIGSILMISIACALMIFSSAPLYDSYRSASGWMQAMALCVPGDVLTGISDQLNGVEMFSPLSVLEDQQLGGIVMMLYQQLIYGFVLAYIFFGWFTEKSLQTDPMPEREDLPYIK